MSHFAEKLKHFTPTLILMSCLFLFQPALGNESTWPQLDLNINTGICSQALGIASETYHSDNFHLYDPPAAPKNITSRFVLYPATLNISDNNALIYDRSVFRKIPKKNELGQTSIYWQINAQNNLRYVISEYALGSQGNLYALFAIDQKISPDQLEIKEYPFIYDNQKALIPLTVEGWRPPLMLQEKDTGVVWAIDVGEPYTFLSDWTVYSIDHDRIKQYCLIHFHPNAKSPIDLLPDSVQSLSRWLDQASGNGRDESSFHSTDVIKKNVMHTWANIALRPWAALKEQPYNSRSTVDSRLKKWSRQSRVSNNIYQNISVEYPKAERALAEYYETHFDKDDEEAQHMAKKALDVAYRMYFVFPQQ